MAQRKYKCLICDEKVENIKSHLSQAHPGCPADGPPRRSRKQGAAAGGKRRAAAEKIGLALPATRAVCGRKVAAMHEVFGLGPAPRALPPWGATVPITVFDAEDFPLVADFVPDIDPNYIFEPDLLKTVFLGLELGVPTYLWGHAGVGKSSVFEQICARTGRPYLRVQHTANMEECHVIGQYVFRDGATAWEDGPLPFAMRHGLLYLADEYDFALPHVLSLYQPALEGKPLVIKEAPEDLRIVKPHPEFRICATGNSNGAGDDTGLYQGVTLQNFANYERFGVVEHVRGLNRKQEIAALRAQTGIREGEAKQLVDYALEIRRAHDAGKVGATISLRALIHTALIGQRRGDWKAALALAFVNRLNATDREVCGQIAQRKFG